MKLSLCVCVWFFTCSKHTTLHLTDSHLSDLILQRGRGGAVAANRVFSPSFPKIVFLVGSWMLTSRQPYRVVSGRRGLELVSSWKLTSRQPYRVILGRRGLELVSSWMLTSRQPYRVVSGRRRLELVSSWMLTSREPYRVVSGRRGLELVSSWMLTSRQPYRVVSGRRRLGAQRGMAFKHKCAKAK